MSVVQKQLTAFLFEDPDQAVFSSMEKTKKTFVLREGQFVNEKTSETFKYTSIPQELLQKDPSEKNEFVQEPRMQDQRSWMELN